MNENESKEYQTIRTFTEEEKAKLIEEAQNKKAFEVSEPVIDDNTAGYFQIKEVHLLLDRISCELSSQIFPLRSVEVKLRDWDFEHAPIPKHEEYAKIIDGELAKLKDIKIKLLQVLSGLGYDVDNVFKVVHPDSEGECPKDLENTKLE